MWVVRYRSVLMWVEQSPVCYWVRWQWRRDGPGNCEGPRRTRHTLGSATGLPCTPQLITQARYFKQARGHSFKIILPRRKYFPKKGLSALFSWLILKTLILLKCFNKVKTFYMSTAFITLKCCSKTCFIHCFFELFKINYSVKINYFLTVCLVVKEK